MSKEAGSAPLALELERLHRQVDAVTRISSLVTSATTLSELLGEIMDLTVEVMEVEAGSLCLLDEVSREIVFAVTRGPRAEDVQRLRLGWGLGIVVG